MAYGQAAGSSIGSLLRFIQEQKSQSPMVPPATETGSPIRAMTQEPLKAPEDIGTQKVVSLKPEGVIGESPEAPLTEGGVPGAALPSGMGTMGTQLGAAPRTSFGWAGIGGPGIDMVAKNEPGPGMNIPSATKTVGDVVNKTGAATPIATRISATTPTTQGQTVQQVNRTYNPTGIETTMADTQARIAAGDRSLADTQARTAEMERQFAIDQAESDRQIAAADQRGVQQFGNWFQGQTRNRPSPTPTPAPQQSQQSQRGQVSTAPPKIVTSYNKPAQPAYQAPTQSYSAPKPAPQQSVAQKIATVIQQSPWSWLFGKR
jgi:hypothetical protein